MAVTVGTVAESGLRWSKNSIWQSQNAAHPAEGPGYFYHGTLPGVPNSGTYIGYNDTFSFTVEVGGNVGHAQLYIHGYFVTAL